MSDVKPRWRPQALRQVSSDFDTPSGFTPIRVVGMGGLTGMSADFIEPDKITTPSDWESLVADLDQWGEVPDPSTISSISSEETSRGLVLQISAELEWIAEFLPWGSDGLLRTRSRNAPENFDAPTGGFFWKERDVVILRRKVEDRESVESELEKALRGGDLESCRTLLEESGKALGRFHKSMSNIRNLPPDQKRWNARNEKIEGLLRAQFIWRAPYTKEQPCTVTLMDVRFSDLSGESIRVSVPRLSDALVPHDSEKPAIRDLASLVHDLSRIHHRVESELGLSELRSYLIEGWRKTAPDEWASDRAFYSHRGGLAIWEYEQCLMDVLEASANQSGAPQPAVKMLMYVKMYQKRMFNNRTFAALSFMAFFFGASSLINQFPPSILEFVTSATFFLVGYLSFRTYRRMSPPPEKPFMDV
tara:strand:- start:361 stop:1617 length:1257 start_codon:yes stop_codon:yes gene_type:complete